MTDDPNTQKLLAVIARLQTELDQLRLNVGRVRVDGSQVRDALADLAVGVSDVMVTLLSRFDQVDRELADMHASIQLAADVLRRRDERDGASK